MKKHTDMCKELTTKRKVWEEEWKNHCKRCGGTGEVYHKGDFVPWGNGTTQLLDDADVCSDCVEKGMCPRCGNLSLEDHSDGLFWYCQACELDSEIMSASDVPPVFECFCDGEPGDEPKIDIQLSVKIAERVYEELNRLMDLDPTPDDVNNTVVLMFLGKLVNDVETEFFLGKM